MKESNDGGRVVDAIERWMIPQRFVIGPHYCSHQIRRILVWSKMSASKYYYILECTKQSTMEEIKRSYRRLVLQFHPDKNSTGAEQFKRIQEAWEVLRFLLSYHPSHMYKQWEYAKYLRSIWWNGRRDGTTTRRLGFFFLQSKSRLHHDDSFLLVFSIHTLLRPIPHFHFSERR